MRFLLDENVHGGTTRLLIDLGHDVLHVAGSEWRSQPDERIVEICNEQERILITLDVGISFAARALETGLVLLRIPGNFDQRTVPKLLEAFVADAEASDLEGVITVIFPGRAPRSTRLRQLG